MACLYGIQVALPPAKKQNAAQVICCIVLHDGAWVNLERVSPTEKVLSSSSFFFSEI